MGLVSVLTPTIRGREWFLDRCKRSVLAQGYAPLEHVVVAGDGLSASQAFQLALESSQGEFVIPVSDDDWLAPHAVETLVRAFAAGDFEVVFGDTLIVSPGNSRLTAMGGAVMWRRSLTERLGGFDPRWRFAADTELYGRFIDDEATSIGYVGEPLYVQTEHALHGSFVHREELALELAEIAALRARPALEVVRG